MHRTSGRQTGLARALVSLAAVLGLAITGVVVASGPAHAAPTVCDPGYKKLTFSTWGTSRQVTHAEYWQIPKGGKLSETVTVERVKRLTASATFGTEGVVGADFAIAKLDAKVNFSLKAEGTKTTKSSTTFKISVERAGKYAVWRGKKQVSGKFTAKRCTADGKKLLTTTGKVKSWGVDGKGAAPCGKKYRKSSWEHKAQKIAC